MASLDAWHAERVERLRSETGWLTLTGLDWLDRDGEFGVGSGEGLPVHLPAAAPPQLGTLTRTGAEVRFTPSPGVAVTADGPTVIASGTVSLYVIDRDGRLGVRIKDTAAPARTRFTGVPRFAVDPGSRVTARLELHVPPVDLEIPTVLGTVTREPSPGVLVFDLGGETRRLHPVGEPDDSLFIVFGDTSNGHTSYGGGRFLSTGPVSTDGTVELDFNKAINPPCAFSEFATCPLPPRENKLSVAILAGERVPEGPLPGH